MYSGRSAIVVALGALTFGLQGYNTELVPGKTVKWLRSEAKYYVDSTGSGVSTDLVLAAVRDAFQSWAASGMPMVFTKVSSPIFTLEVSPPGMPTRPAPLNAAQIVTDPQTGAVVDVRQAM